ncbi:ORF3 [torque teno Delphinidae virus 51]
MYRSECTTPDQGWDSRRLAAMARLQRTRRRLRAKQQQLRFRHHLFYRKLDELGEYGISGVPGTTTTKADVAATGRETQSTYTVRKRYAKGGRGTGTTNTTGRCYTPGETTLSGPRDLRPTSHPTAVAATDRNAELQKTINELYGHCKTSTPRPYPALSNICFRV